MVQREELGRCGGMREGTRDVTLETIALRRRDRS
jgi:hypothetical protein